MKSYTQAKQIARKNNIKSAKQYFKSCKKLGLPSRPYDKYKEWNGFKEFLGAYPSFEVARRIVREKKFKTYQDFQKNKPENIPSCPNTYYKKQWKGHSDFIGKKVSLRKKKFFTYQEAKKIMQELGIKTSNQYYKLYKQNKLPQGLPSHPDEFYGGKN